jgi:histidinol-phosphate phosphatase family domain/HAD-superfamily hydrolase, subfamily IIIA
MTLKDIELEGYETLFLDRDGVINRHRPNDYVKTWEEFEFLPDVLEALALFNQKFKYIIVVTNQRGVGKNLMSEGSLRNIHDKMVEEVEKKGGRIDKIYYCTALSNADPNRKPGIGLFLQALRDFPEINRSTCIMVGDSESDMLFAQNAGIKGIRI